MNKIYKVIWNATLSAWVAVSELAKGKTKSSKITGSVRAVVAIVGVISFSPDAFAGGYSAGGGNINAACNSASTTSGQTGAIAIGGNAQNPCASQPYTIAIGNNAQALSQGSIAIGSGAYANSSSSVDGTGAVAFGNDAVAIGKNSFALGAQASVVEDNTVSFGHAIGDDKYTSGTKAGTWTTDRFMRVANIANGYKNNDAVNVSQIKPLATALGTTVDATTGVVAPPSYTITKTDGTSYAAVNTVPAALNNLNSEITKAITFAGNTGTSANKLGSTLNITGTGSTTGSYTGNNLKTSVSGSTVSIQMAEAPVFTGTVTAGNLATGGTLSVTGVSNLNGGANLNSQKITNVAAGTATGDAVNFGQLTTTNQNVSNLTTTVTNQGNQITTNTSDISTLKGGFNLQSNGKNSGAIKAGDTIDIGVATPADTNLTATKTGNNVAFALSKDLNLTSVTTGNTVINTAGVTADKVTVGTVVVDKTTGINAGGKKITNVAAGDISAVTSTDAVNGGQLFTTNQNVAKNTSDISTLNTTVTNQGNQITTNTSNIATNTSNIATNTSDISTLKGGFNLQSNGKNSGAIKAGDTIDIGVATPADTNLTATKTGNNVAFALSKDLNLTSVTTGNTVINTAGVTADKVTVGTVVVDKTTGINAGGKKITNVAAGDISAVTSTDAVNGGQLFTTNQNVAKNTSDISTLNTTVTNQGNQITTNTSNIATNTSNIATNTSDISTLKGGFNLQSNGKNSGAIKAGDTVDIGVATPADTNLTATKTGNNVAFALSKDLNLTSVTTGNTVINTAGVTADKVTVGTVVVDKTTGINAGGKKITNVAAGDISAVTSTDAVNGGQLFTTNQNVAKNTSDISTLNTTVTNQGNQITTNTSDISTLKGGFNLQSNGKNSGAIKAGDTIDIGVATPADTNLTATKTGNNVAFALSKDLNLTSVTTGNTVINNAGVTADKVTVGTVVVDKTTGINAGGKKITNVAEGDISAATSTDAVNGGQLFTTNQNVAKNTSDISTLNTTVTNQGNQITTNTSNIATNTSDISTLKGGFNLQTNGKNSGAIKAGDTVDIGVATPADTNLTATKTGNNVAFALSKDLNLTSVTTGNTVINNAGVTADKVTVGTVVVDKTTGINAGGKKITNVAAGDISTAASTDAVNGGQLFTTNQNVAKNTSDISTLNTTVTNQGNQITTNTSNIATNTSDISTLKGGFNLQTNGKSSGAIKAGDTVDIGVATPADTNLTATKTGNNVAFALSKDLNLTSVTTGNTVINTAGVTADKVTVGTVVVDKTTGINAGGKKITNVAAGDISAVTSTDAVNGGQLFTTNQNVAKNTSDISTLNTTVTNQGNQITTNTSDISTLKGGFNLQTNGQNSGAIKAGDTVDIGVATPADTNLTATKTGNNVAFALSKDLNLTSVTTGNTVINTAGITADKVTVGNVVIDKTTNKISGVEAGTDAKDVVNKGQLDALAGQQTATDNSAVKYDNATTKDKVTLAGGATGTTLTNVKAGDVSANSTDAINGSQLYTTNQNVAQNSKDIATNTSNIATNTSNIATNTSDITTLKGGFNLQTNGQNSGAIKAGDTVDIGVATPADTNLTATKTGNNVAFALSKDLNLTSVTTGNTVINTAGVTADKVTVGNVVIDKTTNKISGVEAGTDAKDVVNKGQLDALAGQQTATDNSAVKYDNATTKDKVTLAGTAGTTISNVKAGAINSTSTDAINGSQLHGVADSVKNVIGGSTTIDATTGAITTNNIGGTGSNTIDGAINSVKDSATKAKSTVTAGDNVVVTAGTNADGSSNYQVATAKDVNFDKVTVGTVVVDKASNTIKGLSNTTWNGTAVSGQAATEDQLQAVDSKLGNLDGAAVKYDDAATKDKITLAGGATGTTLTNVKAGAVNSTSTDAINGSQLYTTNQNVAQNSKDIATNTSNIATNTSNIATNTSDITTLKGGFNLQTNGQNSGAIKAGDTVDIGVATPADTNLTATKTGNNVAFALSKDLNLTSVTTGNTVINTAGITADKVTVGNVVIDKTTNKISGVEAGTDAKDVVNKGQLDALAGQQTATDNSAVKYDNATTKDKVTLAGTAGTTISNVKAGAINSTSTDAINGSQLHGVADSVKNVIGGSTTIDATTGAITTNNIGGTGSNTIDGAINSVKDSATKAKSTVTAGDNVVVTAGTNADGSSNYQVATAKDVNFDKVTVGTVVVDKASNTIKGLSNTTWNGTAVSGQAATEDQLQAVDSKLGNLDGAAVKYDDAATKDKITLAGGATGTTLTNVKAGAVNSTSTDAINGSQLHGVADSVKNVIGGSTTIDATTGAITTNNIGGTGSNTIDGAINSVKDSATKAKSTVTAGDNVVVTAGTNADGSSNYQVATAKDVNFDKVTVGTVVVDKASNTIKGLSNTTWNGTAVSGQAATEDQLQAVDSKLGNLDGAAVKYDDAATKDKITLAGTAGTTISNVKAGAINSTSTDAINGSQLHGVADSVKKVIGGSTTIDATTGAITTNNIGGTGSNTIDGAINSVKDSATKAKSTVTAGDNVVVTAGTNADGSSNYQVATAKDVNFDKVTVGTVVVDKASNTIKGLSNTTWNGTAVSGQAATEDQLQAVDSKLGNLDGAAVKYDNATTKDKVTLAGTAGTTISNVKAGAINSTSTDAINGSQLHGVADSVKNVIGGSTTIDATTGAITTNNIGGTGSNTIDGAINSVKDSATKAKSTVTAGDNVVVTAGTNADGSSNYQVATAKDVNFDKVTVGTVVVDKASNTIKGLSNTTWNGTAVSGQAATEDQLQAVDSKLGNLDGAAVKYDDAATKDKITLAGTAGTTISNVKAGAVNSTSTDAINGSQLHGVADSVKNVIGGSTTIDATTGAITTNNIGGTGSNTIDGAINSVKDSATKAKSTVTAGDNVVVTAGTNADGSSNYQVATAKDVNFDKVTVGTVVVDKASNTIKGLSNTTWNGTAVSGQAATEDQLQAVDSKLGNLDGAAVKYDDAATKDKVTLAGGATGTTLTNVKVGDVNSTSTDAINGSQLHGVADSVKKVIGGSTTIDATTGAITTNNIGGTGSNTIDGAINSVKDSATKAKSTVTAGDNVVVTAGTNADGSSNYQVATAKDVNFDKVTVGTVVVDKTSNTIKGLSNTTWNGTAVSGQAATEDQLQAVDSKLGNLDGAAVKYDDATTKDKITLAGTAGTTISNVKAGAINSTSTDAINGSQLHGVADSVKNVIGGSTTIDATTGAITTNNIGGTGSNTIDGAINSVKDSATKAKSTVTAGDNVVVTAGTNADGSSNYQVATAKDVNFDKVTVGNVVVNKTSDTIEGLSNKDITAGDFATKGRAATEEQLKQAVTKNITEVVDGNGNKVNIIDQVVNTKPDNKNQDSLFLTYDKQGQETTDRLTIGQTVQKMNTDGIKFFHTNADMSKGDLGATNDSSAGGLNSTAIGVNAIVATGADSAVALGHNTKAVGKQSIAIGQGAEALGTQSISIGTGNKVKGNHSGAIGDPTIVDGANSYSVGNNNQVLTDDTFVLGNNVTKTVAGSVVLGNGSAATTGAGVAGYALSAATSADKTAISNTTSTTGAVAVGDAASGIYRQITGVAAGSADADAVNVAQLKAVGNQVVTTQNALVNGLGGNAKVNADGTITGPTYNVAQGNQSNVGDALTALDKAIGSAATTSKTTVSNGQNIVVNKSKNADGSDNYEVSTAKDLTVDSVKAGDTVLNNTGISIGNNAVVINNTGLTIAGGPSVTVAGINAGNKTITNVANAVNATDAVNKGQLDSAIGTVNNNVNELANNAVKYDDASKDKITLGGGTNGTTISNVKDGAVSQGSKDAVNGGQLWNVQQQVDQNSTDISNIKNDINNGTVGLVQQAGKDATVTVAKDTGGTSVSVAGTDGNRVVTGVKDGAVNATSKDAVNGSQLNTTNQAVVNYLGGGAGYDNITGSFTAPTYNVGDSKYNNVGGAIDALNQADQALNSKIDNVSNKLDNAFRITNNRIDDVEKKANAGIAAAMALESAPYIPGKYTYAAGAAYHGGENAVGVTLRKTADNGRWSITGGVAAASQGDPSVRIGISGVID